MKEKQHEQQVGNILSYFRQTMRIMRLSLFFLVVSTAMAFSAATYSQSTKLSVNLRDATVREVIKAIENQSEFLFLYQEGQVDLNRRVSIRAEGKQLQEILDEVFRGTDNIYIVSDRQVVIGKAPRKTLEAQLSVLQKDLKTVIEQPQQKEISGKVTDTSGEPLPGATVMVKGTTIGTVTDANGNFSLRIPANAQTLQISFVGMKTVEIPIGNRITFNIVLEEEAIGLEEIVAVGYGTMKKVNLTGAVASVDSKMIEGRPITNVSAGLAGLLPGVYVRQTTGLPGSDNATIRVRGIGTLNNAAPMVLIDGIEASMSDVVANDIANISVLKDAASAAIYGSKAANGVILITTKSGKEGKPVVNYSGDVGLQSPTRLPEYLGSADYAVLYNEALANSGKPARFTDEDIKLFRDGTDPYGHPDTDWLDLLYSGSGFLTTHNFSISGGNEHAQYHSAVNYQQQDGIIKYTGKKEYSGRTNLTFSPNKWLTTNINLSYKQMDREEPNNAYVGGGLDQIIRQAYRIAPWIPYKNEDGTYGTISDGNPIAWIDLGPQIFEKSKTFLGIGSMQLNVFEGFDLKATVSHRNVETDNKEMNKEIQYNATKYHGPTKLTQRLYNNYRNTFDLTANYLNSIDGSHNIGLLAGYHAESFNYKYTMAYRENFPSTELGDINGGSTNGMKNEGYTRELNMVSWFGRVNYDYQGKYLLEGNVRFDKSSRFAKEKRLGLFPSFSAGWRISEEPFFENAREYVDNLKIRASLGVLGNQDALNDYYPTVPTLSLGNDYPFNSLIHSGAAIVRAKNAGLLWEKTTSYGLGLDATIFNKLNLTLDLYKKQTSDIIMEVPSPDEFALTGFYDNVGKVDNKGIEVSADYNDYFGKINFHFGTNFAYNKNKLLQLAGTNEIISGSTIRRVGEPIDAWFGYKTAGLYQSVNEIENWPKNTIYSTQLKPGDLKYVDVTGDGEVNSEDRVILGQQTPPFNFGFNFGIGYKHFDFLALFQGTLGGNGYMNFDAIGATNGDAQKPAKFWLKRWNPNNTNTDVPRVIDNIYGPSMPQNSTTDYWLRSTDYLRLKNLQLGYNVPSDKIKKWGVSRLRIYYSAQNLFTLTSFLKGWDPEIPSGRGSNYPVVMTNSFGINLSF